MLPRTEQTVVVALGVLVAFFAFDRSQGDVRAFVTFGVIVAFAVFAAWYVRLTDHD